MALALLLSLLIIAIAFPILSFVFDFLGADENVRNLSISYVEIWFFGLPFFAFAMVASSLMRAMGDIARPGYLMALSALLQIAFGPALIFGAGEFSGFGLIGAAIAFVLARTIGFLLYVYFFVRDKALIFSIKDMIKEGTISDGMIPKTETALYALDGGVRAVVILDGRVPNACLLELFTEHGAGSLIRN